MAYIPGANTNTGEFVQTTQIWDIGQMGDISLEPTRLREILVRLALNLNQIALALNTKETGKYLVEEFVTSGLYFNSAAKSQDQLRPVYRKVIDIGALGAAVAIAHGLTIGDTWSFVKIYGVASDYPNNNYYPLPWVKADGTANIELRLDDTNVVITNDTGLTFPVCTVVVEYLKQ